MKINVLSVFDGISCGQVALERAGIEVENYFASEIDKYAIQIAQRNYPKTVQLGDVNNWKEWNLPHIDLIIAGSPCQGFSNAGKGLNFEDPRSKLFFKFCDILAHYKPAKYLLENVKMKKEWRDIITDRMKVEPVLINSALVSAQNRNRLYWANWEFGQPEDKHIYLKDIIENGAVDREKSYVIDANYYKGGNPRSYFEDGKRQLVFEHQSHKRAMVRVANVYKGGGQNGNVYSVEGKSPPILAGIGVKGRGIGSSNAPKIFVTQGAAIRNQVTKRGVEEQPNIRKDEKSNCVVPTYTAKLNGLVFVGGIGEKDWAGDGKKLSRNFSQGYRVYSSEGKGAILAATPKGLGGYSGIYEIEDKGDFVYRKLTVLECERLQTLPEGYTDGVSNTQRYKCIGNGWTIDVLAHIFSHMNYTV